MLLELRFSIYTLGLGAGTFLAALYGMNLKNFMEESDLGFWGVSAFSALICGMVLMYGMGRLRRVQRVSMWGECGPERGLGLGSAKRVAKELKAPSAEETGRGLWGLGQGTASAGIGALGSSAEIRAERLRKMGEKVEKQHHYGHHGHPARRRKADVRTPANGEVGEASSGLGNTPSGLGAKPTGGSAAFD